MAVTGLVVVAVAVGAAFGFPSRFVALFEVGVSAITLVMVFAIQHTQGREQAATQRKLDELIRALPGADEGLMMLEEASSEALLEIEQGQREIRAAAPAVDLLAIASADHR
jgi:low affinity Fe/Cu permease